MIDTDFATLVSNEFNSLEKGVVVFHVTCSDIEPAFNRVLLTTSRYNGESFSDNSVVQCDDDIDLLSFNQVRCVDTSTTFRDGDIIKDVWVHLAPKNERKMLYV